MELENGASSRDYICMLGSCLCASLMRHCQWESKYNRLAGAPEVVEEARVWKAAMLQLLLLVLKRRKVNAFNVLVIWGPVAGSRVEGDILITRRLTTSYVTWEAHAHEFRSFKRACLSQIV